MKQCQHRWRQSQGRKPYSSEDEDARRTVPHRGCARSSSSSSSVLLAGIVLVLLEASLPLQAHGLVVGRNGRAGRAPVNAFQQTLRNHRNMQYVADLHLGGQQLAGIFDTGSFELVVRSTRCQLCVHPTPPYDHARSSTYTLNGTTKTHVFGSGPCTSVMGYDTAEVGGMVSQHQSFWEILSHEIPVLDQANFAAIVGIGPNFGYDSAENTLLMNFGVDEFSVCLKRESGAEGFLTWGASATSHLDRRNDFASAKVVGKHHWVTTLTNVTFAEGDVDSHLVQAPCGNGHGCAAIVDSGTSLIAAPGAALLQLSQQIPRIKEDCSNLDELPSLRFNLDGLPFELPPQAYVMRITGAILEADDIWDILFFKPKIRKVDICVSAFTQLEIHSKFGPVWILGMPFFRYYHTTFDRTNKAMHFASAEADCTPRPHEASVSVRSARGAAAVALALNNNSVARDEGALARPGLLRMAPLLDIDISAALPPWQSGTSLRATSEKQASRLESTEFVMEL
eukprot:TRINITY_DN18434_c0_g1_i2.p1 TRINITY_DN18434_c0_g1~~TRINITY_DN18434_c0_g1_i2.p1  ORF type:complete len:541 (+),score=99.48 TRINITY_DN18434_c0_g1_i2:94-1623(+)